MTSILPVGPPLSSFLGWKAGTRLLLLALLLLVSNRADAAPPADKEKVDNKQDLAQFRAYLPAIRAKALRDNERQHVLDLDRYFKL